MSYKYGISKTISFLFCFTFTLIFSQTTGKVISISDGDTITVLINGNTQKRLRLAEVDCPENGQPFGKNAKQFTSDQVFGKTIKYYETDTDRYGRTIAKVYYDDNKYLSAELIKSGLGWWYHYFSENLELAKLETQAREKKLGLWIEENSISPWDYRKAQRNK